MQPTRNIGRKIWAIAEGYIPEGSHGPQPAMESHETVCILNCGELEANVKLTIFFADREPAGPYHLHIPPRRTLHQRTNNLEVPEKVPHGQDYSILLESDVPIVVQHTRLDSRQAENALVTTIAYSQESA